MCIYNFVHLIKISLELRLLDQYNYESHHYMPVSLMAVQWLNLTMTLWRVATITIILQLGTETEQLKSLLWVLSPVRDSTGIWPRLAGPEPWLLTMRFWGFLSHVAGCSLGDLSQFNLALAVLSFAFLCHQGVSFISKCLDNVISKKWKLAFEKIYIWFSSNVQFFFTFTLTIFISSLTNCLIILLAPNFFFQLM